MVRYNNATVTIYGETVTVNDEGDKIKSYAQLDTVIGDVQPARLGEEELKLYGVDTKKAEVKKFFYNGINKNIKVGNRASVQSTLTDSTDLYNIMPVNAWCRHGECLLIPVENE